MIKIIFKINLRIIKIIMKIKIMKVNLVNLEFCKHIVVFWVNRLWNHLTQILVNNLQVSSELLLEIKIIIIEYNFLSLKKYYEYLFYMFYNIY